MITKLIATVRAGIDRSQSWAERLCRQHAAWSFGSAGVVLVGEVGTGADGDEPGLLLSRAPPLRMEGKVDHCGLDLDCGHMETPITASPVGLIPCVSRLRGHRGTMSRGPNHRRADGPFPSSFVASTNGHLCLRFKHRRPPLPTESSRLEQALRDQETDQIKTKNKRGKRCESQVPAASPAPAFRPSTTIVRTQCKQNLKNNVRLCTNRNQSCMKKAIILACVHA